MRDLVVVQSVCIRSDAAPFNCRSSTAHFPPKTQPRPAHGKSIKQRVSCPDLKAQGGAPDRHRRRAHRMGLPRIVIAGVRKRGRVEVHVRRAGRSCDQRVPPIWGQRLPNVGRGVLGSEPLLRRSPKVGRISHTHTHTTKFGPKLVKFCPVLANDVERRPQFAKLAQLWPESGQREAGVRRDPKNPLRRAALRTAELHRFLSVEQVPLSIGTIYKSHATEMALGVQPCACSNMGRCRTPQKVDARGLARCETGSPRTHLGEYQVLPA